MKALIDILPIETAPHDRPIQVYRPRAGWHLAKYTLDQFAKRPRPYWDSWSQVRSVAEDRADIPTHWCELPKPGDIPDSESETGWPVDRRERE